MLLELIWQEDAGQVEEASLYIDSQAALKALRSNKPVLGLQLADPIHQAYDRVLEKHPGTCIGGSHAAHKDCTGNDEADRLACIKPCLLG